MNFIRVNWLLCLLLGLLVVLQYQYHFGYANVNELAKKTTLNESLQRENIKLQNEYLRLVAEIEDLQTGSAVMEQQARSILGFIKKDEIFVQYQ